jgi:hypothetical protein
MSEDDLFAWCDQEPTVRYPAVAREITIHYGKDGEPLQWTSLSLRLLDKAPNRIAVLRQYVADVEFMSWHVSAEARAANLKFLRVLESYPDPAVAAFVTEQSARLSIISDDWLRAEREADSKKDQSFE